MTTELDQPEPWVEIFRSLRLPDCDQQVLILSAVGIHSWTTVRDGLFVVLVSANDAEAAIGHLQAVAREESTPRPKPVVTPAQPRPWIGSALYCLILIGIAHAAGASLGGYDWFGTGYLRDTVIHQQQWWRTFTALTLHGDVGHLSGNLLFGSVLGYLAARILGNGVAWGLIVLSAAAGNMLDAFLMAPDQRSLGASTAVFAALGLLASHGWRSQDRSGMRWARRLGPLIAGVALLGFTGAGSERTDVVAHLAGFACGVLAGLISVRLTQRQLKKPLLQWFGSVFAVGSLALAWGVALN